MASTGPANGSAEASSSSSSISPSSADLALAGFKLTRVLSQDAKTRSAALLGTLPRRPPATSGGEEDDDEEREDAIVLLEKTHFQESFYANLGVVEPGQDGEGSGDDRRSTKRVRLDDGGEGDGDQTAAPAPTSTTATTKTTTVRLAHLSDVQSLGQNDIYTWLLARHASHSPTSTTPPPADIKLTLIRPASAAHIAKHSTQEKVMIYETPQMYREKTLPWIEAQDASRIQWVYNILEGRKETESILYRDPHPTLGLVILPDLKWDRKTLSSLYLQAIVQDRSLRSLRDLTPSHLPLLRKIRTVAARVVAEEYGLGHSHYNNGREKIRCFIHYHPSYYHLHVHVLSADYTSHAGAIVGQAHLLDDVKDLLEMGVNMKSRTLGCALGSGHELVGILGGDQSTAAAAAAPAPPPAGANEGAAS